MHKDDLFDDGKLQDNTLQGSTLQGSTLQGSMSRHPEWYDPDADYSHARYAFALRVGISTAAVSGDEWHRIEPILQGVWVVIHGGLTWEDARPAVYHSWIAAKRFGEAE